MDDKYTQYVTTNNLGYAPRDVNAELLKPFDEAMHNIYLEREKLLKDKPPGFEIELEKLNQRGISLADRSQGFKNFNVVQPDGSSYSYTPDIKKTIDPADLLKGKKIQELTEADKQLINLNKGAAYAYSQEVDPKILEELKGQSTELLNRLGCGEKYADGGRIKFGEGSNCFNKGLAKIESGKLNKGELNLVKNFVNKIPAPIKAVGKVFGIGDVILETILAAPDVLQGDIEAAKRGSIFGLFGYGKELDEEILEQAKNKESVQRAIQNLKLTPELRNLMEEKKGIEQGLKKGVGEFQPVLIQNLDRINNRIKEINDYLSKNQYLEEDETNFLNTAFDLAKAKAKKAEEMFGPRFKEAQGPTLEQTLFKKILDEEGYSELIPEESKQKVAGTYTPIEIPEIQAPDDSMRQGFKKGGISRRDILALLTGAAAAPELIKAVKGTKKAAQTARVASKIKFEKAQGMYEWFPDLVEKIKVKGKPFEEKDLIMEASYKHEAKGYGGLPKGIEKLTKHVDGDTTFILREYPDQRIAVDIFSPRNQGGLDMPVTLYYRPTMKLKYYSKEMVEPAEFKVLEKEPRYFANGPDDVDIELSEARKVPGKDVVYGDVEAAERFATGKIKNRNVIPVKQMRRDQMIDEPVDFIEETSPYGPDTY